MRTHPKNPPSSLAAAYLRTGGLALALGFLGTLGNAHAQTVFNESFTGTSTGSGWVFGSSATSTDPYLTANTIDSPGNGWLRLTENLGNQSTYALLDTEIFSVNARIEITMDYAFYNGSGADGITFFLVDGSVNASTFAPGAYGGSMGYANGHSLPGMTGGYLGFALDNWGNYSNPTEDRVGGTGFVPNSIAVRGPESSGYAFIDGSGPLQDVSGGGQMDFPSYTTRPDQTGADYRSFKIIFDANNQLEVLMKFGASGDYISVFTSDLSAYERPETFKIGFTGATGASTEIHEVRNVQLVSTPWSSGSGAYEWDNGAGTTTWGTSAGTETNNNWYSSITGDDNKTPTPGSDILFGNKPSSGPQTVNVANDVEVRNMTFDTPYNYTLNGAGTITFGKDADGKGLPSINVNNYNEDNANGRHKINNALTILENIAIRNFSYSTLCLNGAMNLGANTLTTSGYGLTNLNGVITGSGSIVVNGSAANPRTGQGIVTISGNNSGTYTGTITVNSGQLVALHDNALGTTGTATSQAINQDRTAGNTTIRVSSGVAANLSVGQEIFGAGIAPGTTIVSITGSGGNRTVTLSQALTANVTNGNTFTFASNYTRINDGGTLTLRGGVTSGESLLISGTGATLGRGEQAGAIYNDGGDNTLSGGIVLTGNAAIGSRAGNLTLSGILGGDNSLAKIGNGVVTLSNTANSYSGATTIEGGVLRITGGADALRGGFATGGNSGGNLTLAGGVLEIGVNTDFTRRLGTATDRVQWTGDGGFSAFGGDRTVTLTNSAGSAGGQLTWNAGSFVPTGNALLLSSDYATGKLTLTNAIALGGEIREIRVANGSSVIDGELTGVLSGTGGINKTGAGTLTITANNTYTGATRISGGALRYTNNNQIDGSNLQLNGGVLEIGNSNFSRSLGTGTAAVQWLGDGGFAAFNAAARTVTLGSGTRTWGETNFVGLDNRLIFGSVSANNTASLQNALALGDDAGTRTIHTIRGTSTTVADGALSGIVSGSANLAVTGNGRLDLTAANIYTGTTAIIGSEVRLRDSGTLATTAGTITVRQGGALTLDNSGTANLGDRVTSGVTLAGGSVNFLGAAAASSETIGVVTLSSGANTINIQRNGTNSAQLTAASLSRTAGATVDFTNAAGGGTLGTSGSNPRALFSAAPAQTNGILAYATVNGTAFATHGTDGIAAITPDFASGFTATLNAGQDTTTGLGGATDRQVNSITFTTGNLDLSSRNLDIVSGGLLATTSTASTINGAGTLTSSSGELITHVYGSGGFTISAQITNSGSTPVALTKSGDGTLTLSGATANTYTGATTVNAGTLVLAKSDGVTALSSTSITVGDGRGIDTLRLDANEQINDAANLTLRGGQVGNSANVARLELNGAANESFGSRVESFASLHIEGNAVLDFGGGTPCSPTFLYLDSLTVAADSLLTIANWIEFTDFLLVKKDGFDKDAYTRVIFEGYGGSASWKSYDSDYYQIIPYSPVPEPASFGLLSLGGLVGFSLLRRRRRST